MKLLKFNKRVNMNLW